VGKEWGSEMNTRKQRRWLIATGVPLALAQIAFSFALDGWMAPIMAMFGTCIALRTIDLIYERNL
jgi:hypothetical protein